MRVATWNQSCSRGKLPLLAAADSVDALTTMEFRAPVKLYLDEAAIRPPQHPADGRRRRAASKQAANFELSRLFNQHLSVVIVDGNDSEQLRTCFRLRADAYMNGFMGHGGFGLENFPDAPYNAREEAGESDRYEPHSYHGLITHRETSIPLGTVRLIVPGPQLPVTALPSIKAFIDTHQSSSISDLGLDPAKETLGEISRLSISPRALARAFRTDGATRKNPAFKCCLALAHMKILRILCEKHRISTVVSGTENQIKEKYEKLGFGLQQACKEFYFKARWRAVFTGSVKAILENIPREFHDIIMDGPVAYPSELRSVASEHRNSRLRAAQRFCMAT
jgi:hypothetical protein